MNKSILIPIILAAIMISICIIVSSTLGSVLAFIPGILIALGFQLSSFQKKAPPPQRIVPLYLLALGVQFLHFSEEYLTGFTIEIPKLLNQPEYPQDYWIVFNMCAYFLFIMGGIVLFKRAKEFLIIPLFFVIFGTLFNSIAHVLLSMYTGGYFPGLYTSLINLMIGVLLFRELLQSN